MFRALMIIWILHFVVQNSKQSHQLVYRGDPLSDLQTKITLIEIMQKYFSQETAQGVVVVGERTRTFIGTHLPAVMYDAENLLQPCAGSYLDLDGYAFFTSSSTLHSLIYKGLYCRRHSALKLPTKQMILIQMHSSNDTIEDHHLRYFHQLKNHRVLHLIIIRLHDDDENMYPNIIPSYNPFMTKSFLEPGVFLKHNSFNKISHVLHSRFTDMHQYPLNATLFPFNLSTHPALLHARDNIRGGWVFSYALELRFKNNLHFVIPQGNQSYGAVGNGSATGSFAEVIDHRMELTLNVTLQWYGYHVFQQDLLVLALFTAVISCVIAADFVKSHSTDLAPDLDLHSSIILVIKSIFSMSVLRVPKRYLERILMASCLLFSIVVGYVFCGKLFHLMKSRPQLPNIDTMQKLQDSSLPVVTTSQIFLHAMDGLQNTSLQRLIEHMVYQYHSQVPCTYE